MSTVKLLFHPHVTLAATITAVAAVAGSCTAFVAALHPLLEFPKLAAIVTRVDGDLLATGVGLGVLATLLTVVAGLGRSFAPLIDGTVNPRT